MDECEIAYERGFNASRAGRSMNENPYSFNAARKAEWLAWNDGFTAGEAENDSETDGAYERLAGGWIGPGA